MSISKPLWETHVWRKKQSRADSNQTKNVTYVHIWGFWHPQKGFTFPQHHTIRFIQRGLNYFLITNLQKESVNRTNAFAEFSTDH